MAKLNVSRNPIFTHEGATAKHINTEQQLRRSVMSCLLWEKEFYESGEMIADRIASLVPQVDPEHVAQMAIEARTQMHLRHVPLLLVREMATHTTHRYLVAKTLECIIQRPDELSEFVAIYWKDDKVPLSNQVKKGLAAAFPKFSEYQLAKYNRDGQIKLRDVLFLCHAKPRNAEQDALWKRLINNELAVPDTWEVSLSAKDGISKQEKWERLLKEGKLGAMALLRNLRNMQQEHVNEEVVIQALRSMKPAKVLPFRFIAAARYAPQWEQYLEEGMLKCLETQGKLPGKTVLLVDVSGSMDERISFKSDMTRLEAACGLAILAREVCEQVDILTFSNTVVRVPARRGFALRDAIVSSQQHGGTFLGAAVKSIYSQERPAFQVRNYWQSVNLTFDGFGLSPDRLVVITDEQSHDPVSDPQGKGYMINVASHQNGVGYGAWTHVDGWSEAVIRFVQSLEVETDNNC